jgi:hypothetical protein
MFEPVMVLAQPADVRCIPSPPFAVCSGDDVMELSRSFNAAGDPALTLIPRARNLTARPLLLGIELLASALQHAARLRFWKGQASGVHLLALHDQHDDPYDVLSVFSRMLIPGRYWHT